MTPPNHADIAVVTVTFNSASVLPEFFDCLKAQTVPYRLFAVDNASSDESVRWMRANADASIEIISRSDNAGVAVGNNEGIRRALASGFRWIVLLNNDTAFGPTLFEDLVRSAELHSAEVVVPSLRFYDEPEQGMV